MTKEEINITYKIDGKNYTLEGVPLYMWQAFTTESKIHFPDAGEDAPFHYLSSVIAATVSSSSYFMTDVPRENAAAITSALNEVGWEWENFHAYLLRAAVIPGALNIISLHDNKQNFGTVVITGIRDSVFKKLQDATGHSIRKILATFILAAEQGSITFAPETTFIDAVNE